MSKHEKELEQLRHSAAHLLAHAVSELFPKTKMTIGPATKNGFFYDFEPEENFKEEDLEKISQRMLEIANLNLEITHEEIPKQQARTLYADNPFKLELIDNIPGDTVGIARQGDFYDLCRGGHVASTGLLKHFILTGISGSYWRADQSNAKLQRISGTAFFTKKELRMHLKRQQEAAKYDHRKLGKTMDLFSFQEQGVGFPFFHPKGQHVINSLKSYMRAQWEKYNYQEIQTPTMLSKDLWLQSGHYEHYKNNMYFCSIDDQEYAVKPMNCPGSILVYKNRPHSYRELPLKLAEFGHVHRFELSGVLHGLFRVRAFTQDDTHMYCSVDQLEEQITTNIKLICEVLQKCSFENFSFAVSTKPEKALGTDEYWEQATAALTGALEKAGQPYVIQEGEGAFYGPKIEVTIEDSMGRQWQCSTIQVDFFLPQNFELDYVTSQGTKAQPVILHQAIYGSLERFFGILLEHTKGHLPLWLAPTQAKVLHITDDQSGYAQQVTDKLAAAGMRAVHDLSHEPLNAKIKAAQLERIPWIIIVGEKEEQAQTVCLRPCQGKQEFGLHVQDLVDRFAKQNA